MSSSRQLIAAITLLLGLVTPAWSKLVTVPFDDSRIVYSTDWTVLTPPTTSATALSTGLFTSAPKTTAAVAESAQAVCDTLTSVNATSQPGWTESSVAGASFSFQFVGTRVSILTTAGQNATRFTVTRDNNTDTQAQVAANVLGTSNCRATYESAPLTEEGVTHTLSVTVGTVEAGQALRLLAIVYEDGDNSPAAPDASPHGKASAGVIIAVAVVATLVGLFAIFVPLIYCCRRSGRPMYVDTEDGSSALRVVAKEKALGLLSSTPTFLRHDGTKKVKTHIRLMSDELDLDTQKSKSTTEYSRFSLLRPPVPRKPVPAFEPQMAIRDQKKHRQQPSIQWQVNNRTPGVTFTESSLSHGRI